MKSTLITILQQRMDKCTTEQFWIVAAITTLNVGLIIQRELLLASLPAAALVAASLVAALYGAYFVVHLHLAYYANRAEQVALLQDSPEAPPLLRTIKDPWRRSSLLGVVFYVAWIAGSLLGVIFAYAPALHASL